MSPPIFNPDGSEVNEIVLPDGSTASQVIGPDGNVVFEAGADIPDSVVDDFEEYLYEDQGLTLNDRYSGDLTAFQRQQSTVLQGNYSLEYSASENDGKFIETTDFTVEQGDTYRFDLQTPAQNDVSAYIIFGAQDTSLTDAYSAALTVADRLQITKWAGGSFSILNENTSLNYNLGSDEQYTIELVWGTDDSISIELFDSTDTSGGTVSTTDSSYTSGGIGWRVFNTTTNSKQYYFDDFRIV